MKKIIVASFQRSGTHFLINNLATNFARVGNGWVDIVRGRPNRWVSDVNRRNLQEKIREQLVDSYASSRIRRCVKTHYQCYYLEKHLDEILEKYDILYAIRDPRDLMVSCFHFYNNTNFEGFIKDDNLSSFIRRDLWRARSERNPFSYSYAKPRHIVDKWQKHVLSWLPYKGRGVTFVHYADLKRKHAETLKAIESATSQKLNSTITEVSLSDKRYRPDYKDSKVQRAQVGGWKTTLSPADVEFIDGWLLNDVKAVSYRDS